MRTIKLLVLGAIVLALAIVGVANMHPIDLRLLPVEIAGPGTGLVGVPLAAVLMAAVLIGVVVGQILEYLRESKYRRAADEARREATRLKRELARLNEAQGKNAEDALPLPAIRR
ncbi:MAG: hypothetical protein ACFBSD_11355 [Paracoccaceae bacterium]